MTRSVVILGALVELVGYRKFDYSLRVARPTLEANVIAGAPKRLRSLATSRPPSTSHFGRVSFFFFMLAFSCAAALVISSTFRMCFVSIQVREKSIQLDFIGFMLFASEGANDRAESAEQS